MRKFSRTSERTKRWSCRDAAHRFVTGSPSFSFPIRPDRLRVPLMQEKLSLTGKKWVLRREGVTQDIAQTLRSERGIDDDPAARLSDPFLFPEMKTAVDRIRRAMEKGEKIAIFGDYDADGVTASAQLLRFFRRHGIEPLVHLPHRALEGYGMKKMSIDALQKKGAQLLITVDTGIAAHAEIAHAKSLGMDVIITDHHRPQGGRPDALAVIHPQVPSAFPNAHLAGSGVAFMLVRALEGCQPWEGIDLDIALATIGTVGDLVPLTGENRTLVIHGLKFLSKLPSSPLKDFIEEVRGTGPLTAGDVAFRIVPRINAAGRMAHPDIALRAILEGGESLAELHKLNGDRRSFVDELDHLLSKEAKEHHAFIVVTSQNVTPGTAGLLASRFTERTGRPSLVAAILGENAVGSIRSPEGLDVLECLEHPSVRPFLLTYGGHAQAAGCTFLAADAVRLRDALSAALAERGIDAESLTPVLTIDAELPPSEVNANFVRGLSSLEPFGAGNDEPVFLLKAQTIADLRAVGSDASHLQCRIGQIKAIGFGLGAHAGKLGSERVDVACRVGMNAWNGKESVQLMIEDIRSCR